MFVRFVIGKQDEQSHSRQGVFQAAFFLRDTGQLERHEEDWLEGELKWLRMHLKSPACLRASGNHRALSWFHPRARVAIRKVRSIAALLEEKGIFVNMVTTRDPGTIIYEDGLQVVAKPHRKRKRGI
jgi:hypothetical protein